MKVIYIAGAYRDNDSIGVIANIFHATQVAYRLWKEGWAVICPHMNTAHFHDLPQEIILSGDIEILSRCDAVYMLKNWENSDGAQAEYLMAQKLGLEILYEE